MFLVSTTLTLFLFLAPSGGMCACTPFPSPPNKLTRVHARTCMPAGKRVRCDSAGCSQLQGMLRNPNVLEPICPMSSTFWSLLPHGQKEVTFLGIGTQHVDLQHVDFMSKNQTLVAITFVHKFRQTPTKHPQGKRLYFSTLPQFL